MMSVDGAMNCHAVALGFGKKQERDSPLFVKKFMENYFSYKKRH